MDGKPLKKLEAVGILEEAGVAGGLRVSRLLNDPAIDVTVEPVAGFGKSLLTEKAGDNNVG